MRVLRIVDFSGRALGELREGPDGQLQLSVLDAVYGTELEALRDELARGPVYERFKELLTVDGKAAEAMRRRQVLPGQPRFMEGARDLLRRKKLGETRIRGLLIVDSEA